MARNKPQGETMDNWHILETTFEPQALHHKETVFTIGNGYLGTRGAFEEGYPGAWPMTLIHGLFDDIPVAYTELVNAPNWIDFSIAIDGEYFRLDRGEILDYCRALDLRTGILTRTARWKSPAGHVIDVAFERFASLDDEHLLAVRCTLTSVNFTGPVEFRAGLSGTMDNMGWMHWEWVNQKAIGDRAVALEVRTKSTQIKLGAVARLDVIDTPDAEYVLEMCHANPTVVARVTIEPGQTFTADKLVTVFTTRDTQTPQLDAMDRLNFALMHGYELLRETHAAAWEAEWEHCNVTIEGDDEADLALRYSLFQLLAAAPRHDDRVSIAAKALSGFGYRGHVFWDTEIFLLPFFTHTRPEIARNLLHYRYHTLPGARRKAKANGYQGAMFAWESAATGDETTPRWGLPPDGDPVRIWCGDIEHHITADVVYAIHQYWRITGDDAFMRDYGAEIVLDTARFWTARVEWELENERYEITDVIGPDEYHEHVDNNAYTNYLARWNLQTAKAIWAWLQREYPEQAAALAGTLAITPQELARWDDVIEKLYLPYAAETGLIEQFEGYFDFKDPPLAEFEPRTKSLQAILGVEGAQAYQFIKQPDVLMLLYLLDDLYDTETARANWDYYTPRTDLTYGSSLGPAIQAALCAREGDPEEGYQHFRLAARTDLEDVRGNAHEGIHAATAGGLWQAAVFGFGGLRIGENGPEVDPRLPSNWTRLKFRVIYRGETHEFDIQG